MKPTIKALLPLLCVTLLSACATDCKPVTETIYLRQEVPPALLTCAPVPVGDVATSSDAARFIVDLGDAYGQTCANLKAVGEIVK